MVGVAVDARNVEDINCTEAGAAPVTVSEGEASGLRVVKTSSAVGVGVEDNAVLASKRVSLAPSLVEGKDTDDGRAETAAHVDGWMRGEFEGGELPSLKPVAT